MCPVPSMTRADRSVEESIAEAAVDESETSMPLWFVIEVIRPSLMLISVGPRAAVLPAMWTLRI